MEDRQTNRLSESLNIFETIVNNRVFSNVSIILFLNKTDLLEEKVKQVSIKDYFPEFSGDPTSLADVQHFLVECFRKKRREQQHKPLYHHFTTAINTENIRLVFRDVKDTILHDNLKQLMLQWGGGGMKDGLMGGISWCQGAFFLTYFPTPFLFVFRTVIVSYSTHTSFNEFGLSLHLNCVLKPPLLPPFPSRFSALLSLWFKAAVDSKTTVKVLPKPPIYILL